MWIIYTNMRSILHLKKIAFSWPIPIILIRYTLHLKERFGKINEHEKPLVWGCSRPVWALFYTYWKEKKIQLFWRCLQTYTANSAQIWRNFLPMYHWLFKKAGCFIFQYVKNKAQTGPEQPQASGISCSLILLNRSFKWSVKHMSDFFSPDFRYMYMTQIVCRRGY